MDEKIKRIIDANINRVSEGLRVSEDIFRYSLDNEGLQKSLKSLRHNLLSCINRDYYIASRSSLEDIGYSSKGKKEYDRKGVREIVSANLKRAEEGLRVLEEVFKLEGKTVSMKIKHLRYELYDLEKSASAFLEKKRLAKGLYLVMTDPTTGYEELASMAVKAKIPAIQIRQKKGTDRMLVDTAQKLRKITEGTETLLIVNDRLDIAKICKADGVHLGQDDVEPKTARSYLGDSFLIGLSTHNLRQVRNARNEPVDYIGFGPVWVTDSKEKPDPVTGTANLEKAVGMSRHPVVAIGGINRDRINELSGIGFNNIAVIRAVQDAKDPYKEMRFFNSIGGHR